MGGRGPGLRGGQPEAARQACSGGEGKPGSRRASSLIVQRGDVCRAGGRVRGKLSAELRALPCRPALRQDSGHRTVGGRELRSEGGGHAEAGPGFGSKGADVGPGPCRSRCPARPMRALLCSLRTILWFFHFNLRFTFPRSEPVRVSPGRPRGPVYLHRCSSALGTEITSGAMERRRSPGQEERPR